MGKINEVISEIKPIDYSLIEAAQKRLDSLTKPQGSLGKLEEIAGRISGIRGTCRPALKNKVIFTLAADHGVTEEGISAYPKEVTQQMVYNFLRGGAGINVLARHAGARVIVVDMGTAEKLKIENEELKTGKFKDKKINFGTKNMVNGPAMAREEAVRAIEAGIEVFEEEFLNGIDVAGLGEMGIGNTTSASAITCAVTGGLAEEVTGRGTGIDDKALLRKIEAVKKAIDINRPDKEDGIDVLAKVGGFEIGGLAGIILAASSKRVPVVIDGFISAAAALIAYKLKSEVKNYMFAGHCSVEKGHRIIFNYLGLEPILDFNLRLGEGTGAALAINVLEASVKILNEMATFEQAGVSEKD